MKQPLSTITPHTLLLSIVYCYSIKPEIFITLSLYAPNANSTGEGTLCISFTAVSQP